MMKPFTKARLNIAEDGTVQHFENCAGFVHHVVCGTTRFLMTSTSGDIELSENVVGVQRFHCGELVTSYLNLRPCWRRFLNMFIQRVELVSRLFCGMQFANLPRASRESCVSVLAIARSRVASAGTSSCTQAAGVERSPIHALGLIIRAFGRLVEIFDVLGTAILGTVSLRYLHLDGGDIDIRSGRGQLLQQYPSPG